MNAHTTKPGRSFGEVVCKSASGLLKGDGRCKLGNAGEEGAPPLVQARGKREADAPSDAKVRARETKASQQQDLKLRSIHEQTPHRLAPR